MAGKFGGDVEVMGDQEEGGVDFGGEVSDEGEGLLGAGGVESAGGFVSEDELGTVGHGAGDGDALLLTNGHFSGAIVKPISKADAFEDVGGPFFFRGTTGEGHSHEDIFEGGETGEEVVGLEDVSDVLSAEVIA